MMLSQHTMWQPITGLGCDAILACNAVKTLPIKEPAEPQNEHLSPEQLESFLVP